MDNFLIPQQTNQNKQRSYSCSYAESLNIYSNIPIETRRADGDKTEIKNDGKKRYRVVIKTEKPFEKKFRGSAQIMQELGMMFETYGKFIGPITAEFKNDKELIIKGSADKDFKLLQNVWPKNGFAGIVMEKIFETYNIDSVPELMLTGTTHSNISPPSKAFLKRIYGIDEIVHKGGPTFDMTFESSTKRNIALNSGFVQAGATAIKVREWVPTINFSQCKKCQKYNHRQDQCNKMVCKYCAAHGRHTSDKCPEINNVDQHRCSNCEGEYAKGHNASDRGKCMFYLEEYIKACEKANIKVDERSKISYNKIKNKHPGAIDIDKIKQRQVDSINFNRMMYGDKDYLNKDHDEVWENIFDESLVKSLKLKRDELTK